MFLLFKKPSNFSKFCDRSQRVKVKSVTSFKFAVQARENFGVSFFLQYFKWTTKDSEKMFSKNISPENLSRNSNLISPIEVFGLWKKVKKLQVVWGPRCQDEGPPIDKFSENTKKSSTFKTLSHNCSTIKFLWAKKKY